jgi:hypothetical protein
LALAVTLALMAGAARAAVVCTAEVQCRGDARQMCAPSGLRIELAEGDRLWIDRQGPYETEKTRGDGATVWRLPLFPGHELIVRDAGDFLYRGNRGKRFTGQCEGMD